MRAAGTLLFTLAVLVNSIVCPFRARTLGPDERLLGFYITANSDLWYKNPELSDPPLEKAKEGPSHFLEKRNVIIGFGELAGPLLAMRNGEGKAYVVENEQRKYIEDNEFERYGIVGMMPIEHDMRYGYHNFNGRTYSSSCDHF